VDTDEAEDKMDPDEAAKRDNFRRMKQAALDSADWKGETNWMEETMSDEPVPGYKEDKCDGGESGRYNFWGRGAKWNKKTKRYEKDLNNRLGGIVMPTFAMLGAANTVGGEPFFDENTKSGFNRKFDKMVETSRYWRTQMIMSYLHCKLGIQGTCEETTAPDCNVYYQCQCANNGLGKDYHPNTNPECKKCAVMCRNNANARVGNDRVCESASMSLKTKRSCAKHSGPGADATCKDWCEKWYTERTRTVRSREYGICAGYTDEDWDKVARLLVNNPTSKGKKITKKDLDRGRGGEVTRLLIKQDG
jgi:hypothetical protein